MTASLSGPRAPVQYILDDGAPSFVGIKMALQERIERQCSVGDRLPTIRELSRDMGVSTTNMQAAVRALVQDGVLFSRKRLGLFVRALPTSPPAQRDQGRSLQGKTIGIMAFCDPLPPFLQRMMIGFRQAIADSGAETVVITVSEEDTLPPPLPGCWGLTVLNPRSHFELPASWRNAVVISTAEHLHQDMSRFDRIGVDQHQGGMLAGQIARRANCRRACFLGRWVAPKIKRYDPTSSARLHGFEQTWGTHLQGPDLLYTRSYGIDSGAVAFAEYMKLTPRPDAVFAACDDIAIGFLAAATAAGLRAGRDFHLVGFDGQDERSSSGGVELTTVRVPAFEMGRLAGQLMLLRTADPSRSIQRVALPCSLIAGETAVPTRHI